MKHKFVQQLLVAVILFALVMLPAAQADDGDYYNFDYEDFWKAYTAYGFSNLGESRLPCNGASESSCAWAWQPWYVHGTNIPHIESEQWSGRTVSGYALMFTYYGSDKNLHGGVFRQESVQSGHIYCFTMNARAGLDTGHPASTDSRMQVGISPTGDYPDQIVLTSDRINAMNWSAKSNSKYAYEEQGVAAQAEGSTITMFTRAHTDADNQPYVFWDEGSFAEIPLVSQPSSSASSHITGISAIPSANSATISWSTDVSTLGQVLYRQIGSTEPTTPTTPLSYTVYLPLISNTGAWQQSDVGAWQTNHTIQLTGLESKMTYEYVVLAYGYIDGNCASINSESSNPKQFTTP